MTKAIAFSFQSVITSAEADVPKLSSKTIGLAHRAVIDMAISSSGSTAHHQAVWTIATVEDGGARINGPAGNRLIHFLK
jgi:hypothetical protein